jgi:hypothetical protein
MSLSSAFELAFLRETGMSAWQHARFQVRKMEKRQGIEAQVQIWVLSRKREFENLTKPTNLIPDRTRKGAGSLALPVMTMMGLIL